jgi:hypothetical protein
MGRDGEDRRRWGRWEEMGKMGGDGEDGRRWGRWEGDGEDGKEMGKIATRDERFDAKGR